MYESTQKRLIKKAEKAIKLAEEKEQSKEIITHLKELLEMIKTVND